MKRLKLFLAVLVILITASSSTAQGSMLKAIHKKNCLIQLPLDEPISKSYEIDISHFNFASEKEAHSYFSQYSGALYFTRPDFHQSIAIIYLDTKSQSEWTVAEWNSHLEETLKNNLLTQNTFKNEK